MPSLLIVTIVRSTSRAAGRWLIFIIFQLYKTPRSSAANGCRSARIYRSFIPLKAINLTKAAFLGSLYQKRLDHIREIGFPISIIPPVHSDNPVQSFYLLAKAYNSTNIFVNMPAYSRLLVTKVTEVMACRTMLITPAIDHPSGLKNMEQFEDGNHLVYYDQNKPHELLEILEYFRTHPHERDAIATAGWEEITKRHTLEHRVEKMLEDASALPHRERKMRAMEWV